MIKKTVFEFTVERWFREEAVLEVQADSYDETYEIVKQAINNEQINTAPINDTGQIINEAPGHSYQIKTKNDKSGVVSCPIGRFKGEYIE